MMILIYCHMLFMCCYAWLCDKSLMHKYTVNRPYIWRRRYWQWWWGWGWYNIKTIIIIVFVFNMGKHSLARKIYVLQGKMVKHCWGLITCIMMYVLLFYHTNVVMLFLCYILFLYKGLLPWQWCSPKRTLFLMLIDLLGQVCATW